MLFTGYFQQVKPRRKIENRFSKLNVLIVSIQIAAFAYGLLNIMSYISSTTKSSYGSSVFQYTSEATQNDQKCFDNTNGKLTPVSTSNGQRYSAEVTTEYARVLWNRSLGAAMSFIFFNSCVVGLSIINKVWFEFGRHAFRFRSLVIHQNVLVTAEFVCAVMSLVSMSDALQLRQLPRRWLDGCGDSGRFNVVLSAPSYPLYVALGIDLLAIVMSLGLYAYYGWRRCRLDFEILDLRADTQILRKRPLHILINNEPRKHDQPYIEAYKRMLEESVGADKMYITADPRVVATLAEADEMRERERRERIRRAQNENAAILGPPPPSPPPQVFWDRYKQQAWQEMAQMASQPSTAVGGPEAAYESRGGALRGAAAAPQGVSTLASDFHTNEYVPTDRRTPNGSNINNRYDVMQTPRYYDLALSNARQTELYAQQQNALGLNPQQPRQAQAQEPQDGWQQRQRSVLNPPPPTGTVSTTYRGYSPAPTHTAAGLPPRRQRRVGGAGVAGGQVFSM